MTSIHQKILDAAPENNRLLLQLSETDYATSALQQNNCYISDLKKEVGTERHNLKTASKAVASEYADHKKYRDSHMKRLAYKLGRKKEKFQEEATKEEKEWLEAVRIELLTKNNLEQLNSKLVDAEKTNSELLDVGKVHTSAQQQLDTLYKSIFEGPTPDFPGEDEKEQATKQAEVTFNNVQLRMETEKQARTVLLDADKFLSGAIKELDSAMSAATMDVWGVGGSFADMQKSSCLNRAQINVSHVEMLMKQAQRDQPAIQSIGKLDVAEMRFMTDVVFDNIFSDLNARDRIQDSQRICTQAKQKLVKELHAADQRIGVVDGELRRAGGELKNKREDLQQFRASAFDSIANASEAQEAPPDGPPPSYTA